MIKTLIKGNIIKKAFIFVCISMVLFATFAIISEFNDKLNVSVWAQDNDPYVVQPYAGKNSDYGMPSAFDKIYNIYHVTPGNTGGPYMMSGSLNGGPYSTMTDVVTALNTSTQLGASTITESTNIKINFQNIKMTFGETFTLSKVGNYVLTGYLNGDKSNAASTGTLTITAGSLKQNVYLYDLELINRGSMNRGSNDPDTRLGTVKPNGLYVSSSSSGYSNVFVLGSTSIKATNEVYRNNYANVLYNSQDYGYGSTVDAHNGIGAAGLGQSLSFSFTEIPKGTSGVYPDQLENALGSLLAIAYGTPGNFRSDVPNAEVKYNYYKNLPLDAWVKSLRLISANDFKDIYTSYSGTPGYSATAANGSAATYSISVKQPVTGNAIAFASSGSLIIDTAGKISNFGGDVGSTTTSMTNTNATIQMLNADFNNGKDTRLYVANGNVINNYFGVNYIRTYTRSSSGTWSTSDTTMEILVGHCFGLGYTSTANRVATDLLEGGSYTATGLVSLFNPSTYNTPIVTVGKENGDGPDMLTGWDAIQNKEVRFIATQTQTPNTQYMLPCSGGFYFYNGGSYTKNGTTYRSDIIFLGGNLIAHRNAGIYFYTSTTAYNVRLAGGQWQNGSYTTSSGFIVNNSAGTATGYTGSTIYTYGKTDSFKDGNTGNIINCSGIEINAGANYYASTTTTQIGLFQASAGSGSAPLFEFNGGKFTNRDLGTCANIFSVTGIAGTSPHERNTYIKGGEFYTSAGAFIWMYSTDKNVIMEGGYFENTGGVACMPIQIGYYGASTVTTGSSHDPSGYRTYNNAGQLVDSTQGSGGAGILYLNGGTIVSNNSSSSQGLINVTKTNHTTALVMGLAYQPRSQVPDGFLDDQKSDKVTTLVNKGSSPIIRMAPGTNSTTTATIDGAGRTVRYYVHSNSTIAIDRMDFIYQSFPSGVTFPSIVATQVLPEIPFDINFPEIRFTGTMSAGTFNGQAVSGLVGRIQVGVNVIELAPTFNDQGYLNTEHVVEINNINSEIAINGTIIRNYKGDGGDQSLSTSFYPNYYKDHFELYSTSQVSNITNRPSGATSGYQHSDALVGSDWKTQNSIYVNWYTQKGVDQSGNPIPTKQPLKTNNAAFSADNTPIAYLSGSTDNFRSKVYLVSEAFSYFTYKEMLAYNNYNGPVFSDGPSEGMPYLTMDGYKHIGWTYTGLLSPYFDTTTTGLWPTGAYTTAVAQDMYVKGDDFLKNYYDHFLVAVWELDDPIITPSVGGTGVTSHTLNPGEVLTYTYHPNKSLELIGVGMHKATAFINLTLIFEWSYKAVGKTEFVSISGITTGSAKNPTTMIANIANVRENGEYRLALTATDNTYPVPMTATVYYSFTVNINPKTLTADNIDMPMVEFDSHTHSPLEEGFRFVEIIAGEKVELVLIDGTKLGEDDIFDFTVTPGLDARFSGVRAWPFYFTFYGNYSGSNIHVDFVIWGEMTVSFGNLKGAAIEPTLLLANDFEYDELDNRLYPTLPTPTAVNGYTFSHWSYNGQKVEKGDMLPGEFSHALLAVWTLNTPVITTRVGGVITDSLSFEFDRTLHSIVASATIGSPAISGINYSYTWEKWINGQPSIEPSSGTPSLSRMYVEDLTQYRLTVTAYDSGGLSSTSQKFITVQVTPKEMKASDIVITSQPYDGEPKTAYIRIVHNGYYLVEGIDYDIISRPEAGKMIEADEYPFVFNFKGDYLGQNIVQNFIIYTNVTISFGNLKPGLTPVSAIAEAITLVNTSKYPALPDPVIPNGFKGYKFLGWTYNGELVKKGDDIKTVISHTLLASWELLEPSITLSTYNLNFVYAKTPGTVTVSANVDGLVSGLVFTYSWTKKGDADYTYAGATNYFTNVIDSGTYYVKVTVNDGIMYAESDELIELEVVISPRNIEDLDSIKVSIPLVGYAGGEAVTPTISITHFGTILQEGLNLDYTFVCYSVGAPGVELIDVREEGVYILTLTGHGNYMGTRDHEFTVSKDFTVSFVTALGNAPSPLITPTAYDLADKQPTNIPDGYIFLYWGYGLNLDEVKNGDPITMHSTHILTAVWALKPITITNETELLAGIDAEYTRFGYSLTVYHKIEDNPTNILYTYEWKKRSDGTVVGTMVTLTRINVETEYYDLTITATGQAGLKSTVTIENIPIKISPRSLEDPEINIYMPMKNIPNNSSSVTLEYSITYGGVNLTAAEYMIYYYDEQVGEYVTTLPMTYGVGTHTFKFVGTGHFKDERINQFEVENVVAITFYTRLGNTPTQIIPNGNKYPTLPIPTNIPSGYTFVRWQYDGHDLPANGDLAVAGSHLLTAVWVLNPIILTNETQVYTGINGMYTRSGYSLTAYPAITGNPTDTIIYTYEWKLNGVTKSSGQTLNVINVSDSGMYTLTITALSSIGISSSTSYTLNNIFVNITQRLITDASVSINIPEKNISGGQTSVTLEYMITYGGVSLTSPSEYSILYYNGTSYVSTLPTTYVAGTYRFKFVGNGNFGSEKIVEFVVTNPSRITFFTQLGDAVEATPIIGTTYGTLPTVANVPAGYTFKGWYYISGSTQTLVTNTDILMTSGSHTLTAVWELNEIEMTNEATLQLGISGVYTRNSYTLTANPQIALNPTNSGIIYTYVWKRNGVVVSTSQTLSVTNVTESGVYSLTVKAVGVAGIQATDYILDNINVNITPMTLEIGSAVMIDIHEKTVFSLSTTVPLSYIITYNDISLKLSSPKDFEILYFNGTNFVSTLPATFGKGIYTFKFVGYGNFTGEREVEFKVTDTGEVNIMFYSMLSGVTLPNPINIIDYIDGVYGDIDWSKLLPTNIPAGYSFVGWQRDGADISDDDAIPMYSHTLTARYELVDLSIGAIDDYVDFFDWNSYSRTATGKISGLESGYPSSLRLTYEWINGRTGAVWSGATLKFRNVSDSGTWKVVVTVTDTLYGLTLTATHNVIINIKPIDLGNFDINVDNSHADGQIKVGSMPYTGYKYYNPTIVINHKGNLLYSQESLGANADYMVTAIGNTTGAHYLINPGSYRFRVEALAGGNFIGYIDIDFVIKNNTEIFFHTNIDGIANPASTVPTSDNKYPQLLDPMTPDGFDGYKFSHWVYLNSIPVSAGDTVAAYGDIHLTAVWILDVPELLNYTENFFNQEYIHNASVDLKLDVNHPLIGKFGITVSYRWVWTPVNGTTQTFTTVTPLWTIKNVADSGTYELTVTITDNKLGTSASSTHEFTAIITSKKMTSDNIVIDSRPYNGNHQAPNNYIRITDIVNGQQYLLEIGKDYDILELSTEYINAKNYTVSFRFKGNYTQLGGINGVVNKTYSITPYYITFTNVDKLTVTGIYTTEDGLYPTLPFLTGVSGYTFIGWEYVSNEGVMVVGNGDVLAEYRNHALRAIWELNAPDIHGIDDVQKEFDWNAYLIEANATVGTLVIGTDIEVTYVWRRISDSALTPGNVLSVTNVLDSGKYVLTVTVRDLRGLTYGVHAESSSSKSIDIIITPKTLTKENVTVQNQFFTGTGIKAIITITDNDRVLTIEYDYNAYLADDTIVYGHDFIDVGTYELLINFKDNFAGELKVDFTIEKSRSIIEMWWLWLVVGLGMAGILGTLWGVHSYLRAKRKKYGMKRHMHSFMDDFDLNA